MRIFKSKEMGWGDMGLIKLSVLAIGAAAGSYWSEAILPYATWFVVVGVILALIAAARWIRD
ncbi:MAG: hypothetical protein HZA81_00955 [Candidatus Taylorbacteria bacterium]|nr:hypothetical protein [Candidatus Taylorbacteria bacterium]